MLSRMNGSLILQYFKFNIQITVIFCIFVHIGTLCSVINNVCIFYFKVKTFDMNIIDNVSRRLLILHLERENAIDVGDVTMCI